MTNSTPIDKGEIERLAEALDYLALNDRDAECEPEDHDAAAGARALRSLLTQLDEAERALEWMPIETAPKDGTDILVVEEGVVETASWLDSSGNWWASNTSPWNNSDMPLFPTHWRPLPAPPKGTHDGE